MRFFLALSSLFAALGCGADPLTPLCAHRECEEPLPTEEQCNEVDDNFDGDIDEGLDKTYTEYLYGDEYGYLCDHLVGLGCGGRLLLQCAAGEYQCVLEDLCRPEVCDGLDNDGDGEIDNGIEPEFFYPYEEYPDTVGIGECRPGVRICVAGRTQEVPPTIPRDETLECGNDLDDDCDGTRDNRTGPMSPVAISFVVDVSGSNIYLFPAIRSGFCDLSLDVDRRTGGQSAFSLTIYGDARGGVDSARLAQDFTSAAVICLALNNFITVGTSVQERQIEGILVGASASWPPDLARHLVFLSDEPISVISGTVTEGLARVVDSCVSMPYEIHAFLKPETMAEWEPVITACSGYQPHPITEVGDADDLIVPEIGGSCW